MQVLQSPKLAFIRSSRRYAWAVGRKAGYNAVSCHRRIGLAPLKYSLGFLALGRLLTFAPAGRRSVKSKCSISGFPNVEQYELP